MVTSSTVPPTTVPSPEPVGAPLAWRSCGDGLDCAVISVPLDYANPVAAHIDIALERHRADVPTSRIGSLVLNPGGPGDSGIDALPSQLRILSPGLRSRFDIVEFDPRGIGRSAPVHCQQALARDPLPLQPDPVPTTEEARQALTEADRSYARSCAASSATLLPFVGTESVARDLDHIRAALGDERLNFMGQSYGSLLGATYAELFPSTVRAMVLDGVIDPALTTSQLADAQAAGFDRSFAAFAAWCATSSCPWPAGGDAGGRFLQLVATARTRPLAAGRRQLGPAEVYFGALATLYSKGSWPSLARALVAAESGDGAPLLALSDRYLTRGSANFFDANSAVSCLDNPTSRELTFYPRAAAEAAGRGSIFGPLLTWGAMSCAVWPVPPTRTPHAIKAAGSPPILVVGTTHDPATPYAWAASLARQLQHGVLLGREGEDHVAYFYSACVRAAIERYVVAGEVPASATTCAS